MRSRSSKKNAPNSNLRFYGNLTPWQRVMIARHPQRPYTLDYIRAICTDFIELHGDRSFSDDAALVGGLARFEGTPVVVIGQQKGRTVQDRCTGTSACRTRKATEKRCV